MSKLDATTHVPAEAAKSTRSVAVSRTPFVVPGFEAGAAASGMRYRDRLDLALIVAESDAVKASGVFTTNLFAAAPVVLCKEYLEAGRVRAVLVNAGIANACTGEEGMRHAREMSRLAAEGLHLAPESVLVASTGVIGQPIVIEPVARVMPELLQSRRPDGWEAMARAIMTTDLVPKMAVARLDVGGKTVTIGGVAKGSGMIAPNMATMLAFVCTDAAIDQRVLDHWVRLGADNSFNGITVDGDTSTNDTLLVLAGGRAANPVLSDIESPESRRFGEALQAVLLDLAKQVVLDGEGATKFIEIWVSGAPDPQSARQVALTVANSPLVKTAFFGEDANWGRIIAAAGRSGVPMNPERVVLFFGSTCVFENGKPILGSDVEAKASEAFRQKEIQVRLDLGAGGADYVAYTCDFSYDYVKINGSYRS